MDKQQIICRLMSLGDTEEKANHLYDYYKTHDDIEILVRTIELRESDKPEPIDRHIYHSY